jgi:hypothetical protein
MLTGFNLTQLNPNQTSSAIYECTLIASQKPAETLLISNLTSASHTNLNAFEATPPRQDLPSGDDYDYNGALVYFIFLLMWYAVSVIALICSSTKKSRLHYFDDNDNPNVHATNNFLKQKNGENIRHQALGKTLFTFYFLIIV